jgi:outer membrane protein TolC
MNRRIHILAFALSIFTAGTFATAAQSNPSTLRRITLQEAVDLALKHNHVVRIAESAVEEKRNAKDVAKSSYFPVLRNESNFVHLTDTQFIQIPSGSLGVIGTALVPPQPFIINQGGLNLTTSGTGLVQPLTQLLKIRAGNDIARADLDATRGKARGTQNDVAVKVRQLYYKILITESQRSAVEAKIVASDALQSERVQQVKYGSSLEQDVIESRAQAMQAKQELLTTEFQLSDLQLQFKDAVGLPLSTQIALDPNVPVVADTCQREECVKLALQAHPEIAEARAGVEKASAAVRLARREYIPDIDALARYSYQNNVPFLARNFGTFGVRFSYDLFDAGKKSATIREREAQLAQAKENLARVNDEVEVRVQTTYNKLERTKEMVAVSKELLALREESKRVSAQQLVRGEALRSRTQAAVAQQLEATTLLLQSQLDYIQARDELIQAIGQTPQ